MKNRILLFLGGGIIGGILSFFAFGHQNAINGGILFYSPGFIFGAIISSLLYLIYRRGILFHFLYVWVSTVAFYVAVKIYTLFNDNNTTFAFFIAGLVGSAILAVGLWPVYRLSSKQIFIIVIIGSLAALPNPDWGIFPIWQTAVAAAIGYSLNKNFKNP